MDLAQALRLLEDAGTAQNRKIYARHGVRGPTFGVSYADQGKLAKRIGKDAELAEALWKTGNHDARVLAAAIADPARASARQLDQWSKDLDNYGLTDSVAKLAAATSSAKELVLKWIDSDGEWRSSAGWTAIALLAAGDAFSERELARLLARIEEEIHRAPNRTRYAMNQALIAIGAYRAELRDAALAAAERIGPVEVDHGETGCKTPDAASYIAKVVARGAPRSKPAKASAPARAAKPAKSKRTGRR